MFPINLVEMKMHIQVKLFATLVRCVRGVKSGVPFEMELPAGASISYLVKQLNLPENEVKVAFVNGRIQSLDFLLRPGDEVGIFPPVGGG
jgi:molybdopterin synthase sulfur carrier subunit